MSLSLFDSHTHLELKTYGDELPAVLDRARASGVRGMVTIGAGEDLAYSEHAVRLAEMHADVWATVGIHPHHADLYSAERLDALEALARSPRVVALGEMGLDYHYDLSDRRNQREAFVAQIELAQRIELPVVVHSRSAERECVALLDELGLPPRRGIFHCYTGDIPTAEAILERDFYISVPGIVTFKKSLEMQTLVAALPLERMLIETDAPYLTPHPFRGKRNEPSLITHTAAKIAELRGLSIEELSAITDRNARRIYGITD